MAYICEICEKQAVSGSSQKHRRGVAGKRWKNRVTPTKRLFKPNLQKITFEGKTQVLCAKCIKRLKKNASELHLSA
ncbi:hypothetical protein C4564_05845 [Candidatus Microgenomates bacterium]|nr:MAG: hypothetical protein C4564_05845 [Candidatus Microgenomates bacterium]